MSDIEENFSFEAGWVDGHYRDLIEDQGEIVLEYRIGDYQGDLLFVIRDANSFGFVSTGYGSCSGCDYLQACKSIEEVMGLQSWLISKIKWFESLSEFKRYLTHGFQGNNWFSNEPDWDDFVSQVTRLPEPALAE